MLSLFSQPAAPSHTRRLCRQQPPYHPTTGSTMTLRGDTAPTGHITVVPDGEFLIASVSSCAAIAMPVAAQRAACGRQDQVFLLAPTSTSSGEATSSLESAWVFSQASLLPLLRVATPWWRGVALSMSLTPR